MRQARGPIRSAVEIPGIDPDIAWDGDGNCWVHFSGLGGIARCRIDPIDRRAARGPRPDVVRNRACSTPRRRTSSSGRGRGTSSSPKEAPSAATASRSPGGLHRSDRGRALRTTPFSATAARPADTEHRARRSGGGPRRVVVDGPARRATPRDVPRLPRAGPRDVSRPGAVGGRVARGRRARPRRWKPPGHRDPLARSRSSTATTSTHPR